MFPMKLKDCRLFNDANSYLGVLQEMTLPKIVMITEDWRGAGMVGPIPVFQGVETPEVEFTLGGHDDLIVTQAGLLAHDGLLLRAIGAFQSEADGFVTTVEAVMRGRHKEIDLGKWQTGKETEEKSKVVCSYYRLISNGAELLEIDLLAGVFIAGGVDRWADIRAALDG